MASAYSYQGCYADTYALTNCARNGYINISIGKLFPYCAYDQNMNIAKCKEYAIAYGYIVFALQAGTMCFLGNDLLHVTRLGYSNTYGCTYSCPGVGRDYCGGYLSNSIYMLNVPPPPMPPMPPSPPPRPIYFNPPPSPVYLRPSPRPPPPAASPPPPRYPFSPWNPDVPFNPPKLPPPPRASAAAASPESQMGTSVIVIIITVTLVIFITILLLLICCFCRHRHRNATTPIYDYESQRQSQSQRQHYVEPSAPPMHAPDVLPPVKVPAAAAAAAIARRAEPIKDVPDMFTCPITQDVMHDPVIASDGHTYEKSAIEKWIKNGRNVSPMTNTPMASSVLTPNRNLKSAISTYMGS